MTRMITTPSGALMHPINSSAAAAGSPPPPPGSAEPSGSVGAQGPGADTARHLPGARRIGARGDERARPADMKAASPGSRPRRTR